MGVRPTSRPHSGDLQSIPQNTQSKAVPDLGARKMPGAGKHAFLSTGRSSSSVYKSQKCFLFHSSDGLSSRKQKGDCEGTKKIVTKCMCLERRETRGKGSTTKREG